MHFAILAISRAFLKLGNISDRRSVIMAITTRSSTSENPFDLKEYEIPEDECFIKFSFEFGLD
jgi:hypothetical protein